MSMGQNGGLFDVLGGVAGGIAGGVSDVVGGIGSAAGGLSEGIGGFAEGAVDFARKNPEIAAFIAGGLAEGLTGGTFAEGAVGGLQGAQEAIARKRQEQKLLLQQEQLQLEKRKKEEQAFQKIVREQENFLRKDFKAVKDRYTQIRSAQDKLDQSLSQATAAGDLAAIFSFMKIIEPESVVRESEFKTAEEAKAWLGKMDEEGLKVPNFIRTGIEKLSTGKRLLPDQRKDFLTTGRRLFKAESDKYDFARKEIIEQAQRQNLDFRNIIGKERRPLSSLKDLIATAEKNDAKITEQEKKRNAENKVSEKDRQSLLKKYGITR